MALFQLLPGPLMYARKRMYAILCTVNPEVCRVCVSSGSVGSPARVRAAVPIADLVNDQEAGLLADHGGAHARVGGYDVPLEAPADGEGPVALPNEAGQLGRVALVDNLGAEREGNYLGRF